VNAFLGIPGQRRLLAFQQVDAAMSLQAVSVENDFCDIRCLLRAGVGDRALANKTLFRRVAEHREIFFRYSWVDYSTHKPGTFRLSPPADHVANWRADYRDMLGPMFFGEAPTFEQMMAAATEFEKTFNATA
jgi:hypothetical protein